MSKHSFEIHISVMPIKPILDSPMGYMRKVQQRFFRNEMIVSAIRQGEDTDVIEIKFNLQEKFPVDDVFEGRMSADDVVGEIFKRISLSTEQVLKDKGYPIHTIGDAADWFFWEIDG